MTLGRAAGDRMTDISQLESRLDAALSAVGQKLSDAAQGAEVAEKLKLETAKVESLSGQLERARAKVVALRADLQKRDVDGADLQAQIDALKSEAADLTEQRDKARAYASNLKSTQAEMRKQLEANVSDPDLINRALEQEMEHMSEQHAADLAEVNGILARLTPLVEGGDNA